MTILLLFILIPIGIILIAPIGPLCYWLYYRVRRDRVLAQYGIETKKRAIVSEAILKYLSCICGVRNPTRNGRIIRATYIEVIISDVKWFRQEIEMEELKQRERPGELPNRPVWKCTCGRINLPYIDTCVCGMIKQQVPMTVRESISDEEAYWRCLCGRNNAAKFPICTCGREKHQVPVTVRTPSIKTAGKWRCTCGRENPNYTSTCVCGQNKRELPI